MSGVWRGDKIKKDLAAGGGRGGGGRACRGEGHFISLPSAADDSSHKHKSQRLMFPGTVSNRSVL